eukprot:184560_1
MAIYLGCVYIGLTVLFTSFLSEGISWVLIYRTKKFQALKNQIDTMNSKLEESRKRQKENKTKDPKLKKQIKSMEDQLKIYSRDLYIMQMPSNFFLILLFVSAYGFLSALYESYPVAKLPFEPPSLLTRMTHRGLPGDDYSECSMTFILVICSMAIRPNVKKYLGFAPETSNNPWMPNMDDWDLEPEEENNPNDDVDNRK